LPSTTPEGREAEVIDNLVRSRLIENWEAQDEPPHLKIIRDRILRSRQRKVSLLGLYQPILQKGSVAADDSRTQLELRLSCLAVNRNGQLKAYNRIYESVFNLSWVEKELANIHPYAEALAA
jgi:hypothetical protein